MSTQWSDYLEPTSSGLRLTRCPACGVEFDDVEPAAHINNEHSPSDFGLSPLRASEVPADD